mgnify:CR=1 FL=1
MRSCHSSWDYIMPHADFVHLRVHSAYSLAEGAIKVPELAELCAREHMPAVGMTDTGNLFGALEFSTICATKGVQPIVGCQIALANSDTAKNSGHGAPDQLVLLVQDENGYSNILKLVSSAFLDSENGQVPQIDIQMLAQKNSGLIALTGGVMGPVGRRLANGQAEAAESCLLALHEVFQDRLYVELMRHQLPVEEEIEPALLALADRHKLPLVATNEAFFSDQSMFDAHDALLCIAEGVTVGQTDRRRVTPGHYFKSAAEMRAIFEDIPEAITNTLVIAQRCSFMVEERKPMLPNAGNLSAGSTEAETLRSLSSKGLERRLAGEAFSDDEVMKYRNRLGYELDVIIKMGFPGYFLIVSEFIGWAKFSGIPVGPGRGSGAGSLVSWALEITDLDPIRFGLLFERFLNPARISMPDFDIDFCQDRRDEVIRHVQEEYGAKQVAQIITFGKLQARAVLRDVGRVLGMPYGQVDRLCKLIPNNPAAPVTLQQAIDTEPRLKEARYKESGVDQLMDVALRLEGLYRHASTHAAGVVIGDRPLDELVPLYRDPRSSMAVTQFNMKDVEKAGLVKFDFLGLKTLTVMDRAVKLIKESGTDIGLASIPLDDDPTYRLLAGGNTVGVFQMESSGMREVLRKLKADRFEDLIAVVALYRPGPMNNIPSYIERKHGREEVNYLHSILEPILAETYGVMIYQEQVMEIAQLLSGYSLGEADLLRRAMGKKIKSEMSAQRQRFLEGAATSNVPRDKANIIFDQVDKFSGYGFNKSHAAAYALVAYQTAYLKANYPTEFMAALMTSEQGNTDKLGGFYQELVRLGIGLNPPDINSSTGEFLVEKTGDSVGADEIRYSLAAIRNVGENAVSAVVKERGRGGAYRDLFDFAMRMDVAHTNKRQFLSLAKAGTFDSLHSNRAQVAEATELLMRHTTLAENERSNNQENLFGESNTDSNVSSLPVVEDWSTIERLRHEADALGFYLSAHPLDTYDESMANLGVVRYADVMEQADPSKSERVRFAVVVQHRRERSSVRGRYAFIEVSDQSGIFEMVVFTELFTRARDLLEVGSILLIEASIQSQEDSMRIVAQTISKLDEEVSGEIKGFRVYLASETMLEPLTAVIAREQTGSALVSVVQPLGTELEVEVELPGRYAATAAFRAALKSVPGVVDVLDI